MLKKPFLLLSKIRHKKISKETVQWILKHIVSSTATMYSLKRSWSVKPVNFDDMHKDKRQKVV